MRRSWSVGAAAVILVGAVATTRAIEAELLQQIPAETHVVLVMHPESLMATAEIAALIRADAQLKKTWAGRVPPGRIERLAVAYVPRGEQRDRLVVTLGKSTWSAADLASVRGPKRGVTGSATIYAHRTWTDAAWVQVSPRCIVEGPIEIVSALATPGVKHLDGVTPGTPAALLLAESDAGWPAALLYVAPDEAMDVHTMLQDLDRTLGFGMEPVLGSYKSALRMLGVAHGLRVTLRDKDPDYEAGLTIAMPNRMAAQIASVSLEAGAGMAAAASDAAVRAGKMSRADAAAMAAVLATLRSRSDGDLVHVTMVMADSVTGAP